MYATSAEYLAVLNGNNRRWACRVEIVSGDAQIAELTTVDSGEVKLDDVAVRRSLDMTVVDPTGAITPTSARDMLAPRGTEVRVWRGLYVGTAVEWVPLGVFGVIDPEISADNGATVIKISGMDRVDAVRKRRFVKPWRIPQGTLTDQAIASIVTSRLNVPTRITATGHTTPELIYDALSDPWDAVRELADADGLAAYFDPLGALVVAPKVPRITGVTYARGDLLMDSTRVISGEDTYSGVIVKGEHPDFPNVYAEAWDTDPKSPTYYLGPFGKRPYGYSSPVLTATSQAQAAANTLLPKVTRMPQTGRLRALGHPGHDVDDLLTVVDETSRTVGSYVVTGGTIPLRPSGGPIELSIKEAL